MSAVAVVAWGLVLCAGLPWLVVADRRYLARQRRARAVTAAATPAGLAEWLSAAGYATVLTARGAVVVSVGRADGVRLARALARYEVAAGVTLGSYPYGLGRDKRAYTVRLVPAAGAVRTAG